MRSITPQLIEELEADPASMVVENNTFETESGSVNNIGIYDNFGDINKINHNPVEEILKQSDEK